MEAKTGAEFSAPTFLGTFASNQWAYEVLSIPKREITSSHKKLCVAVVDDGFLLPHVAIKEFWYTNPKEIPGNLIDDDGNGYVDDVQGWDISDDDPYVSLPEGREKVFYHGTYIASIIASVFKRCYGKEGSSYLQIMPVKVLGDQAKNTYLSDGYRGIKYAIDNGAQIICCAWSGGNLTVEQKGILQEAIRKGVTIISSTGNFYAEKTESPASFPGVLAVAALDSGLRKAEFSNFGMRIDLALPGLYVMGASTLSVDGYGDHSGTSASAALATGCIAILKTECPMAKSEALFDALKNTAIPLDSLNPSYAGKLGAGLPHLTNAFLYLENKSTRSDFFLSARSKGKLFLDKKSPHVFDIKPYGHYQSIRLHLNHVEEKDKSKEMIIFSQDSLFFKGQLEEMQLGLKVPSSHAKLVFPKSHKVKNLEVEYFVETIDSTSLFCRNTMYLESLEGIISDGSENNHYANGCDCKWQITVPKGKRIQLESLELDTEANVDFIWLFDGTNTLPENIIAKLSGTSLPPSLSSRTHEVLIWFVTSPTQTGKGWKLRYSAF